MEFRNTPDEAQLKWLSTDDLRQQLAIGLRNVGVWEHSTPEFEKWIGYVQRVHHLLSRRSADTSDELGQLSESTGWMMEALLEDCLRWPEVTPYVRDKDGIARRRRSSLCNAREYHSPATIPMCDECSASTMIRLEKRDPPAGLIFFRTYNPSRWCVHANQETVLMTWDEYDFLDDGRCSECLRDERSKWNSV